MNWERPNDRLWREKGFPGLNLRLPIGGMRSEDGIMFEQSAARMAFAALACIQILCRHGQVQHFARVFSVFAGTEALVAFPPGRVLVVARLGARRHQRQRPRAVHLFPILSPEISCLASLQGNLRTAEAASMQGCLHPIPRFRFNAASQEQIGRAHV